MTKTVKDFVLNSKSVNVRVLTNLLPTYFHCFFTYSFFCFPESQLYSQQDIVYFILCTLCQVDLALDVEKALPVMFRQRFATTQEEVYPNANKYWTIWSFWGQTVSPARAIYEAMNPEQVGT